MSMHQPEGRIVVNTPIGICGKINDYEAPPELDFFISGDEPRHYVLSNGKEVVINRFKSIIKKLEKLEF